MQATLSRSEADFGSLLDGTKWNHSDSEFLRGIATAITTEGLSEEFPEVDEDALLLGVSLHWHDMMNNGAVGIVPKKVVLDFGAKFASTENSRFHFELRKRLA